MMVLFLPTLSVVITTSFLSSHPASWWPSSPQERIPTTASRRREAMANLPFHTRTKKRQTKITKSGEVASD
jgi:hypothetical protein